MRLISSRIILPAVLALASAACVTQPASARNGEKTFGLKAGYVGRFTTGNAGIFLTYRFAEHFRLAPAATYMFRKDGVDALAFEADGHFLFSAGGNDRILFYPLAGIAYWSLNTRDLQHPDKAPDDVEHDDVSTRKSRFALNAGAGVQWTVTPTLALGLEVKYAAMHHTPTWVSSLSIAYKF